MGAIDVWNRAYRAMRNAGVPGLHEDDRISSAAYVIQTALDEARAEERRKVVEWLRKEGADFASIGFEGARVTLDHAADTIERGEHHG